MAQRLRAFRKLKGYTQEGLSKELGVSISLLGSIERGMRRPEEALVRRIAEVLGVDRDELVLPESNQ